jgi:hypothetical protein
LTTAKQYRLSKQPTNVRADPTAIASSQEEQDKLLHDQRSEEQKFIEENFKVGPQFALADEDDDALLKIMPENVETVTTPKRDRVVVKVFRSGNRGKATIHLPDWMKYRLELHYDDEGYGAGNNLVELEMDEDWRYVTIKKVPRLP